MATSTMTVTVHVARWRIWLAVALVRAAALAIRFGQWAANRGPRLVMDGVRTKVV